MNRRVLGMLGLSLWALAALACASAAPGAVGGGQPQGGGPSSNASFSSVGSGQPQGGGPSVGAGEYECQTAADCVVVETACCDHCNGGKAEAFNKAHADKHRPEKCEGVICTRRGCGDAIAVCKDNTCRAEIEPLKP